MHLIRDQKVMNDYRIGSLKREKDDAKEVRDGMECGIRLDGFNDIKEGDLLAESVGSGLDSLRELSESVWEGSESFGMAVEWLGLASVWLEKESTSLRERSEWGGEASA